MIWIITLVAGGFVLVVAEIFLPGIIAGIIGVALLLTALIVAAVTHGTSGLAWTLAAETVIGILIFVLWMRYFPGSRLGLKFSLPETDPQKTADALGPDWIGAEGTALTMLRPSGTARIRDRRLDVLTEGLHVEPGTRVTIVKIEGAAIFVRPELSKTTNTPT